MTAANSAICLDDFWSEPDIPWSVQVRGNRVVVTGEIDVATAPILREALTNLDNGPIEVDLSAVTFADTQFLHVLFEARKAHVQFRIVATSRSVDRLLDISSTRSYFGNSGEA